MIYSRGTYQTATVPFDEYWPFSWSNVLRYEDVDFYLMIAYFFV